jgi:hypothetical protein
MGKKKISITKIKNEKMCKLTFYKRKKGLIKKSMELSVLCGVKIFLTIIGPNNLYTFFSSKDTPQEFINKYLLDISNLPVHKEYSVKDVSSVFILFYFVVSIIL